MSAISSYRGNRPTPPVCPPVCHRQGRLQYTAPQLSAQCNEYNAEFSASQYFLRIKPISKCSIIQKIGMMLGLIRKKMSPIICHGANAESRCIGSKGRQHLYDTLSVIILTMFTMQ